MYIALGARLIQHVIAGGEEVSMMESCAILVYLAEKTGKFLSTDPIKRLETLQWLFFQVG